MHPRLLIGTLCALLATAPMSAAENANAAAASAFAAAQAHFLKGRELQTLHRNTPQAAQEFSAASDGFRAVVRDYPNSDIAARALYMAGSAQLFLDQPDAAIAAYNEVIERYATDRAYLAKALVRKASVEKNDLQPAAARLTLARYDTLFAKGTSAPPAADPGEHQRLVRSLAAVGKPATPIAAQRWFGEAPPDDFAGRVTVLYFWATWCPNCRKEVDFVNALEQRFAPQGVRLIGVTSNDRGQTDAAVTAYIAEHGLRFPIAVDAGGKTSQAYAASSVPTAVVIGPDGTVRWHDHPAALDDEVLQRLLAERGAHAAGADAGGAGK